MRTVSLVLVSSFIAALSAGNALAERRTYPGTSCQTTASTRAAAKVDSVGRLFNDSSSFTEFVCPFATRTEFSSAAIAYVNDSRTNAQVACTLTSLDREGDVRHGLLRTTGILEAGRAIQLSFEPGLGVTPNGYVVMACDIPGKSTEGNLSGIASYLGYEQD